MPVTRTIQQRFVQGELDPQMYARVDIDQYYGAAESMENVWPIPQGGFIRRPGLEYIAEHMPTLSRVSSPTITAPNGGTTSNANDDNTGTVLLTTTNISTTDGYVVVQYDLGSSQTVAAVDIVGGKLSGTPGAETEDWYVQVSTNASTWVDAGSAMSFNATEATKRRRVLGSYRYVRLVRVGTYNYGTLKFSLQEFTVWLDSGDSAARMVEFNFNVDQHYLLTFSEGNIAVFRQGALVADIPYTNLTSAQLARMNWAKGGDTLIIVHEDVQPFKVVRGDDHDEWTVSNITFDFVPKYDYVPTESQPAADLTPDLKEGEVTITASAGVFSASHVNQYIEGNGGRGRIISYNSTTEVVVTMEIPFFSTDTISSGDWDLLEGFVDVWSSTYGWPVSVCFYEGRLWFGGSKSRPQTIWGSRSGLFFDFDPGTLLADDGINYTISETGNEILNMYPGRNLIAFTAGEEFIAPQSFDDPLTPTNFSMRRQTSSGSEPGLRPQEFEGGVYFAQRQGQSVQEFLYTDVENAYVNNYTSLLASHLVSNPTDMVLRKAASTTEGSYLVLVNGDGNLTVALVLRSQQITAFVPTTTTGTFKAVGVDLDEIYCMVEREINGQTVRYIERFNDDVFMDAATIVTTGLPTDTFTGLDHLEGEACRVKADGAVMDNATPSSGSVTIARDAASEFQIGLNFDPTVKDLPIEVSELGTVMGKKKRISEVVLQLRNTAGLRVNGKAVPFKGFGPSGAGSPLDNTPILFTGVKRMFGFTGWSDTAQVTITQVDPLPMQVLAISKKVRL